MKRLVESDGPIGPTEKAGIELLRAARPFEAPPLRKVRVRAALARKSTSASMWILRPTVIVGLLLAGAAASASLGRHWLLEMRHAVVPAATSVRPPKVAAEHVAIKPRETAVAAARTEIPAQAPPPQEEPALRRSRLPAPARPAHRMTTALRMEVEAAEVSVPTAAAGSAVAPDDDPALVASALRALRREHDPARASALLADYVQLWPEGSLLEEAMALAVEAASARHDPRLPDLAARYLRRFPGGRFREAMGRALLQTAP